MCWRQLRGQLSRLNSHGSLRLRQTQLLHPLPEGALAAMVRVDGGQISSMAGAVEAGLGEAELDHRPQGQRGRQGVLLAQFFRQRQPSPRTGSAG